MNTSNIKYLALSTLVLSMLITSFAFEDSSRYFQITKNMGLYAKLYKELNKSYVDDVEPATLMRKGVDAMLKSLDPYTNYISEGQIEGYRMKRSAASGDIGVKLMKRKGGKYVEIFEIFEDLPAHKGGLQAGDKIVSVNGEQAADRSVADVQQILKGQPDTEVTLEIIRPGEAGLKQIAVNRNKAKAKSVPHYAMLDKHTGYVKLKSFTARCSNEVAAAIRDLRDNNELKNLVLDLRYNGGGLLKEAINMTNLFVPKGEVVVSTQGKTEEWKKEYKTPEGALIPDMPLIVLINGRSASASEIVSGTIQDLDRGIILGRRSFGKGLVQQTKKIGYNSQLKLTVAKYFLASGRCVQAIDYSGSYKDGNAGKVPDSLRTVFETRNGRKVYDGSGVAPDVEVDDIKYANITQSLRKNHLIFDYITQYRLKNKTIAPAEEYDFSDTDFTDFKQFLANKKYEYDTQTEKVIKRLKDSAKQEKYGTAIADNMDRLEKMLAVEKEKDLDRFKDELKQLLKIEIVARYYYQKGEVAVSLNDNPDVQKALALFADKKAYEEVLAGK